MLGRHINIECVFSERIKLQKSKLHTLKLNKETHTEIIKIKKKYKSYFRKVRNWTDYLCNGGGIWFHSF